MICTLHNFDPLSPSFLYIYLFIYFTSLAAAIACDKGLIHPAGVRRVAHSATKKFSEIEWKSLREEQERCDELNQDIYYANEIIRKQVLQHFCSFQLDTREASFSDPVFYIPSDTQDEEEKEIDQTVVDSSDSKEPEKFEQKALSSLFNFFRIKSRKFSDFSYKSSSSSQPTEAPLLVSPTTLSEPLSQENSSQEPIQDTKCVTCDSTRSASIDFSNDCNEVEPIPIIKTKQRIPIGVFVSTVFGEVVFLIYYLKNKNIKCI